METKNKAAEQIPEIVLDSNFPDCHRVKHEPDEHWELKKEFLLANRGKVANNRLITLANVFQNTLILGTVYCPAVMKEVAQLGHGLGQRYRLARENKLQRYFVPASEAAKSKVTTSRKRPSENVPANNAGPKKFVKINFEPAKAEDLEMSCPKEKPKSGVSHVADDGEKGKNDLQSFISSMRAMSNNTPSSGTLYDLKEKPSVDSSESDAYNVTGRPSFRTDYNIDRPSFGSSDDAMIERPSFGSSNNGSDRPSFGASEDATKGRPAFGSPENGRPAFGLPENGRPSFGSSINANDRPISNKPNNLANRLGPKIDPSPNLVNRLGPKIDPIPAFSSPASSNNKNKVASMMTAFQRHISNKGKGQMSNLFIYFTTSMCSPKATLHSSTEISKIRYSFDFDNKNGVMTLKINNQIVSQRDDAHSTPAQILKHEMSFEVLQNFSKQCYCMILKKSHAGVGAEGVTFVDQEFFHNIESMSDAQIKSTQEAMQQRICDSNKGRALLKMMGWAGGGLGKEEQGRENPVESYLNGGKQCGLGFTAQGKTTTPNSTFVDKRFNNKGRTLIQRFLETSGKTEQLVFSPDFSKEQRAALHKVCQRQKLKTKSYDGENGERYLVIQRTLTITQKIAAVLENGGETDSIRVLPPGTYSIEMEGDNVVYKML